MPELPQKFYGETGTYGDHKCSLCSWHDPFIDLFPDTGPLIMSEFAPVSEEHKQEIAEIVLGAREQQVLMLNKLWHVIVAKLEEF